MKAENKRYECPKCGFTLFGSEVMGEMGGKLEQLCPNCEETPIGDFKPARKYRILNRR